MKAAIIGIGIVFFSKVFSAGLCGWDFTFNEESCPSSEAGVWLGALIGAISTGIFFLIIDLEAKNLFKKFDRRPVSKQKMYLWTIVFIAIILVIGLAFSRGYCLVVYGDFTCPAQEAQIWLGGLLGVVTAALFFFLIGNDISSSLEKLGKVYIVRTCILNMWDLYGKENGWKNF